MTVDMNTIFGIEKVKFREEKGEYFLEISILADSKFEIGRYKVMARLPITSSNISVIDDSYEGKMIDIGFGKLPCVGGIVYETVEKKEQIMTLSEIENKLGYKIKLISEK